MDAFVIRLPAKAGTTLANSDKRLKRLTAAGWRVEAPLGDIQAAVSGRADIGQSGPWTAVGLAKLYNADALRVSHPGASTDMALIAQMRAEHGRDFPDQLTGGFAVVLIHQETGAVEVYRDHFGIVPLYYCIHDGALTCSSDIRAAFHLSALPIADNPVRIADFLAEEEIDAEITAFAGLTRLPAAHSLTWSEGTVQTAQYWALKLSGQVAPEQAPAKVRRLLLKATIGSMQGVASVGAMLSGGLDSTSLTGFAAQHLQEQGNAPLPVLSFVYGSGNPMDESEYIDAANAVYKTAPQPISMAVAPRLEDMPEVIEEQMDFFLAFGLQKSRNIYRVAAENGLTALLDGHGGDEVISHGFDRMVELAAERKWWRLFVEMRGTSRIYGRPFLGAYFLFIARHSGLRERSLIRRLLIRMARPLLPANKIKADKVSTADLLVSDLYERVDAETRYAEDPGPTTRDARLQAEQLGHLRNMQHPRMQIAFEILHRSAARQGILPLYPFYDRSLVEYCLTVPAEAKMRGGLSRWVLREAMQGVLPEKVRLRTTKTDFTDEFRTTVMDHFAAYGAPPPESLDRYVNKDAVQRLYALLPQAAENNNVSILRLYWRLVVLTQWCAAREEWKTLQERGEMI